jgi:hypothetical protein
MGQSGGCLEEWLEDISIRLPEFGSVVHSLMGNSGWQSWQLPDIAMSHVTVSLEDLG